MSLSTLNAKHVGHSSVKPTSAKAGLIVSIGRTILMWQERASMRHNLSQLDQENLNDMGIDHTFVEMEVKKPFWQN
jgi:uncharacterized protein YjiS (DUF1127 family)